MRLILYCSASLNQLKVYLVILLLLTHKSCQLQLPSQEIVCLQSETRSFFFTLLVSESSQHGYNGLRACLVVLGIRVCTLQMN